MCAADPDFLDDDHLPAHQITKLYYMMDTRDLWEAVTELYGEINMQVDGTLRKPVLWEDWAITANDEMIDRALPGFARALKQAQ